VLLKSVPLTRQCCHRRDASALPVLVPMQSPVAATDAAKIRHFPHIFASIIVVPSDCENGFAQTFSARQFNGSNSKGQRDLLSTFRNTIDPDLFYFAFYFDAMG